MNGKLARASVVVAAAALLAGCYVDHGTPPGYGNAEGVDVNAAGTVVATAQATSIPPEAHVLRRDGTWVAIGFLEPGAGSVAAAINDDGVVVGTSGGAGFVWDDEHGIRPIRSLIGVDMPVPVDIADDGSILGSVGLWQASAGRMISMSPLPGATSYGVHAVNDRGQVVGESGGHAVLWEPPGYAPVDLGTAGGGFARAHEINDDGTIVGTAYYGTGIVSRAVRWSAGDHEVEVLDGGGNGESSALAIGDDGTIIGESGSRAVLWDAATRERRPLSRPAGSTEATAAAIDGDHLVGDAWIPDVSGYHVIRYGRPAP